MQAETKCSDVPTRASETRLGDLRKRVDTLEAAELKMARLALEVKIRSAADLPEREILRRFRPLWRPLFPSYQNFSGVEELCDALHGIGHGALADDIIGAAEEAQLMSAARTALAELREVAASFTVHHSPDYKSADEIKSDLRTALSRSDRVADLVAGVDQWFPAYRAAFEKL